MVINRFKRIAISLLTAIMLVSVFCCLFTFERKAKADSVFEGDGTIVEPYRISTLQDLTTLRNAVNAGEDFSGSYFIQTNDLNLSILSNFTPIGTETNLFAGTYDGGGHKITNLSITTEGNAALFINVAGTIRNLGIEGTITGNRAASFTCHATEDAHMYNCYSTAKIYGDETSAGLADTFRGTMSNCWYYTTEDVPAISTLVGNAYYVYATKLAPESAQVNMTMCKEIGLFYFKEPEFIDLLNLGRAVTINNFYLQETDMLRWERDSLPVMTDELNSFEGDGSSKDPFLIQSAEDLVLLSVRVNAGEVYKSLTFEQTKDIDLANVYNFIPIGNFESDRYFYGIYNGCAHTLSNLMILATKECYNNALFAQLAGTVMNLGIESGRIYGANCASIASHSGHMNAVIFNCYSKAFIFGQSRSGGIVDNFAGKVRGCYYYNPAQPKVFLCSLTANKLEICFSNNAVYNNATFRGSMLSPLIKIGPGANDLEDYAEKLNQTAFEYAQDYHMSYVKFAEWTVEDGILTFKGTFEETTLPDIVLDIIESHYTDQLIITKMVLVVVVVVIFTIVIDILLYRRRRDRIDRERRGK